jgi:protein disulfide-isomerase A1
VVVVSFIGSNDAKDLAAFSKVADKHRDSYLFGHASDEAIAKEAGVTAPSVVLYRNFDEPEVKYTGSLSDEEALESFLKAESIPLIDEVGPENFMTYAEANIPLAYYFTDPESTTKAADLEALKPLAKKYKGKLNFVWIDAIKFVNHAKGLNLQGEDWPSFAIQDVQASTKFPLEDLGKDAPAAIAEFVEKFIKCEVLPSSRSQFPLKMAPSLSSSLMNLSRCY